MSSKDFMMRYFEQLAKVLTAIIAKRDVSEFQLALDEIDRVLDSWFELERDGGGNAVVDQLISAVGVAPSVGFEKEKAIAELLYQKSITFMQMGKPKEAYPFLNQSLALFKAIDEKSGEFSLEIQHRIAELDTLVSGAYSA